MGKNKINTLRIEYLKGNQVNFLKNMVKPDIRKGIAGIILAMSVLVISQIWFDWQKGLIFAGAFIILGFLRVDFKYTALNTILNVLWAYAVVVITWYTSYTSTGTLSDISESDEKMLLNSLCIVAVFTFILAITANWKFSISCGSVLLCLLATASGFINQFRGKELSPVDFLSWSTALNVADQYTPKVYEDTFFGWVLCALMVFLALSIPKMPKLHRIWTRITAFICCVVITFGMYYGARDVKIQSWGDFGARFNGYYLNFALGIRDLSFNKPDDYSIHAISLCEQEYAVENNKAEALPNIIVIMDEAYADFRAFGSQINTNIPVTPFIDSLKENTVRGYALASVFGGNTANSEFEFLTGCSLAFLPKNAIPYQQYIKGKLFTLAWYLNDKGYTSTATHPCPAGNWSRGRIYPYFGFSHNTFEDSYPVGGRIREYVSDISVFEHMLDKLKNKPKDCPMFSFGVTMQNHSSYSYSGDNYTQTVELEGYSREYPAAEQYLSLLHETDKAMEYLITQLMDYPEDTVVVVFGDHQPSVEGDFYKELNGGELDTIEEQMKQYKVPFFIWANFDITEKQVDCTSLTYLPVYLLEAAGIELPPFYEFLSNMEREIPALNSLGYYSNKKNSFVSLEEASGAEAEMLNRYSILQYNNLFDTKNRSDVFFENYIDLQ